MSAFETESGRWGGCLTEGQREKAARKKIANTEGISFFRFRF
jgi:hypothetical protein